LQSLDYYCKIYTQKKNRVCDSSINLGLGGSLCEAFTVVLKRIINDSPFGFLVLHNTGKHWGHWLRSPHQYECADLSVFLFKIFVVLLLVADFVY